jgi:hypothetical protein
MLRQLPPVLALNVGDETPQVVRRVLMSCLLPEMGA